MRYLLMGSMLLLAGAAQVAMAKDEAFDAIVAAERAFAADAGANGINAAFMRAAAEHGVVFRPAPVRVADVYGQAPPAEYSLLWGPSAAEIAPSGDLGYTYGPFHVTDATGAVTGAGHYFTVWERDGRGPLRFRSDIGISHAHVPLAGEAVQRRGPVAAPVAATARGAREARLQSLRELESALLPQLRREPPAAVYTALGSDDLVLLRDGHLPLSAPFDETALAIDLGDATLHTVSERMSRDGSLATTYGAPAEGRGPVWVRIWRYTDGAWKLAVDLTLPPAPEDADAG